jgi:hypothetical protein
MVLRGIPSITRVIYPAMPFAAPVPMLMVIPTIAFVRVLPAGIIAIAIVVFPASLVAISVVIPMMSECGPGSKQTAGGKASEKECANGKSFHDNLRESACLMWRGNAIPPPDGAVITLSFWLDHDLL